MPQKVNDSRNEVFERIPPESVEIVTKHQPDLVLGPRHLITFASIKPRIILKITEKETLEGNDIS